MIFIFILSIALYINSLISEFTVTVNNNSSLMNFLNYIVGENAFLIVSINYLLLIIEALYFKKILSDNDLINKKSLLPSFFYIISLSGFVNFHVLQAVLICNLLLLMAVKNILTIYNKPDSYLPIFNLSAFISIASLVYFPSVMYFLFICLSFIIYSLFKWREWLISFLGFLTIYFLFFGISFLLDNFNTEIILFKSYFHAIKFQKINFDIKNIISLSIFALIFLFTFFHTLNKLSEKSIYYRKKIFVLVMLFLCSLSTFLFPSKEISSNLVFVALIAVYFISLYISQIKKAYISEILYLIIIGISVYKLL